MTDPEIPTWLDEDVGLILRDRKYLDYRTQIIDAEGRIRLMATPSESSRIFFDEHTVFMYPQTAQQAICKGFITLYDFLNDRPKNGWNFEVGPPIQAQLSDIPFYTLSYALTTPWRTALLAELRNSTNQVYSLLMTDLALPIWDDFEFDECVLQTSDKCRLVYGGASFEVECNRWAIAIANHRRLGTKSERWTKTLFDMFLAHHKCTPEIYFNLRGVSEAEAEILADFVLEHGGNKYFLAAVPFLSTYRRVLAAGAETPYATSTAEISAWLLDHFPVAFVTYSERQWSQHHKIMDLLWNRNVFLAESEYCFRSSNHLLIDRKYRGDFFMRIAHLVRRKYWRDRSGVLNAFLLLDGDFQGLLISRVF